MRIFISYSHRGKGSVWKAALLGALQTFDQQHLLDVWQDGKIRVSSFWDDDIKQAMGRAQLAVLLLTPEALESPYILDTEFPFLRSRQQRDKLPVFPVVCEPCDWRAHDWLRATQSPNASNPLSDLGLEKQQHIFRQLATEIATELSLHALATLPNADLPEQHRIYLDKFPLTRGKGLLEEKLIGREQELALLDLAFVQPRTSIVSLVAWGGVGKTMLVQHWLQRLQNLSWTGVRRVYAWSFYSQGTTEDRQASEDTFLAHALDWFSVKCEPTLSSWEKGRLLADAVAVEPTLLILDGIEPLQHPPGAMGGQLRAPGVQSLLKHLARKANATEHSGLCLVTTREPLTDLADFERRADSAWGCVLRVDLGNLTDEAGAALLHHAGAKRAGAAQIKTDDAELLAASHDMDGHALTLNLLGRFLARAHGGDIRRRDFVKFEQADREVQGGSTFRVLAAFEIWFSRGNQTERTSLSILRLLGLFDGPAEYEWFDVLRNKPVVRSLTNSFFESKIRICGLRLGAVAISNDTWSSSLSFLQDLRLVMAEGDIDSDQTQWRWIDCHPLIREFFSSTLSRINPRGCLALHRRMFNYFWYSQYHDSKEPSLKELQPLFRSVFHACKSHNFFRAALVFNINILGKDPVRGGTEFNRVRLNMFSAELSALACFFEKPWTRLAKEGLPLGLYRGQILGAASYALRATGRVEEAVEPLMQALSFAKLTKSWPLESSGLANLSELQRTLGQLEDAAGSAEAAMIIADRYARFETFEREGYRGLLADAYFQSGSSDRAAIIFKEAETLLRQRQPSHQFLYSLHGFLYCDFLLHESEQASWRSFLNLGQPDRPIRSLTELEDRSARLLSGAIFEKAAGRRDVGLQQLILCRASLFRSLLQQGRDRRPSAIGPEYTDSEQLTEAMRVAKAFIEGLQGYQARALSRALGKLELDINDTLEAIQAAGDFGEMPRVFLIRAWGRAANGDLKSARDDLDEAWDIAERGPMRLHMADIHLYRARLFFRDKAYPWKSPADDLAAAEKLITDCGYHRRDEEWADAKKAILGS